MVTGAVEVGSTEIFLNDYKHLRVGDVIEIDPGLPTAEVATITRFGSIFLAAPLRYAHQRGAIIRRVIEGTGASYDDREAAGAAAAPERRAQQRF